MFVVPRLAAYSRAARGAAATYTDSPTHRVADGCSQFAVRCAATASRRRRRRRDRQAIRSSWFNFLQSICCSYSLYLQLVATRTGVCRIPIRGIRISRHERTTPAEARSESVVSLSLSLSPSNEATTTNSNSNSTLRPASAATRDDRRGSMSQPAWRRGHFAVDRE